MKITSNLLSFRYRKNFFINYIKKRKQLSDNQLITASHLYCPFCKFNEADLIAEVDRVGIPSDTLVCKQCGFVFNNSFIINPLEYYAAAIKKSNDQSPTEMFTKRTATNAYSWKRMAYVAKSLDDKFSEVKSVFELGCKDGCNLFPYHLMGKKVFGYDIDYRFFSPGRSKGMELVDGDLASITADEKFDLIILIHTLEHIIDLDGTIQQIEKKLNDDGFVFIEVPGIENWNRKNKHKVSAMGLNSSNNIKEYLQYEHNYYFDLDHLKLVMERNGFVMIDGDEWVRAIFCKSYNKNNSFIASKVVTDNNRESVLKYLNSVEADYLSFSNIISRVINKIFCTNIF